MACLATLVFALSACTATSVSTTGRSGDPTNDVGAAAKRPVTVDEYGSRNTRAELQNDRINPPPERR